MNFKKVGLGFVLFGLVLGIGISSSASGSFEATLDSLNSQNFPFTFSNVRVTDNGIAVTDLTADNFKCSENGIVQTDFFQVTSPQTAGGVRLADIVFLIDSSGSMGSAINGVKNNVNTFADALVASDVDYRLGLVQFGQYSDSGHPQLFNSGNLTDAAQFKEFVNTLKATGGYEPGFLALRMAAQGFNFRPGAQKVFLLISDEDSDDRDKEGTITLLQTNDIVVHTAVNCASGNSSSDYCDGTSARAATGGQFFGVQGPYSDILDSIVTQTASTYVIRYKSSNPTFDGTERAMECAITRDADQATVSGSYIPGSAPIITLSAQTEILNQNTLPENSPSAIIRAAVTDEVEPFAKSNGVWLYYRTSGSNSDYRSTMMILNGQYYEATIPIVSSPGVDYYLTATDGEQASSLPSTDPGVYPFQIAVLPNVMPNIAHEPVISAIKNKPITITATITDTTEFLQKATLKYRRMGELLYKTIEMHNTSGDTFEAIIPADYVTDDIEYYLIAKDNFNVAAYKATADEPFVIGFEAVVLPQCSDGKDNDGDGKIDINDTGCVVDGIYDASLNSENQKPAITINETDPLELTDGEDHTFNVTATDSEDGDISDKIIYGGNYDPETTIPGNYTKTFTVTDSGGMTATKTLQVIVKEEAENRPPNAPTNLLQAYDNNVIGVGGTINPDVFNLVVTLSGDISDSDSDRVKFQVEIETLKYLILITDGWTPSGDGVTYESEFKGSGTRAFAYVNISDRVYRWRARTIDEHGLESEWVEFGNNSIAAKDFEANAPQYYSIKVGEDIYHVRYKLKDGTTTLTPFQGERWFYDSSWHHLTYVESKLAGKLAKTAFVYEKMPFIKGQEAYKETVDSSLRIAQRVAITKAFDVCKASLVISAFLWNSTPVVNCIKANLTDSLSPEAIAAALSYLGMKEVDDSYSELIFLTDAMDTKVLDDGNADSIFKLYYDDIGLKQSFHFTVLKNSQGWTDSFWKQFGDSWANTGKEFLDLFTDADNIKQIATQEDKRAVAASDMARYIFNNKEVMDNDLDKLGYFGEALGVYGTISEAKRSIAVFENYKMATEAKIDCWARGLSTEQSGIICESKYDYISAQIHSPGELRVRNAEGNVTGLVNGEAVQEIPNSLYDEGTHSVIIFSPVDVESLHYEVVGIEKPDEESYGLTIETSKDGKATVFNTVGIHTTPGEVHSFSVDWQAITEGEKGAAMQIDKNGDGVFEETVMLASMVFPTTNAGGPYVGTEGTSITFDASLSTDLDGSIILYEWDFNEDGVYEENSTSPIITHIYEDDYNGTVGLRVTDDEGLTAIDTAEVIVNNVVPIVEATASVPIISANTGGGGGIYTAASPTDVSVAINNGESAAESAKVGLTLSASGAVHMAISNSPDFADIGWEDFKTMKEWVLSAGVGEKTVYVKFRSANGGVSAVVSDSINLTEGKVQGAATVNILDGDIIQCRSSADPFAVYIVKVVGDKKYIRHIVSPEIFNHYGHLKWGNIIQVDSLDGYSLSSRVRVSTGPNATSNAGDRVYEINGDQTRHWMNMTAERFLNRGGSDAAIYSINQGELDLYSVGADVTM